MLYPVVYFKICSVQFMTMETMRVCGTLLGKKKQSGVSFKCLVEGQVQQFQWRNGGFQRPCDKGRAKPQITTSESDSDLSPFILCDRFSETQDMWRRDSLVCLLNLEVLFVLLSLSAFFHEPSFSLPSLLLQQYCFCTVQRHCNK